MFICAVHATKKVWYQVEAKAFIRINHFVQLFTITCKKTAGIVVANDNFQELQWLMQECDQHVYNNNTP